MDVTVVAIEHSMETPNAEVGDCTLSNQFARPVLRCPMIHIFGYNSSRRSCCVHVHDVFPYFFVPVYDPRVSALQLGMELEAIAVRTLQLREGSRLVHLVHVVQGTPFYGLFDAPRLFYKVFVYDPSSVPRLVNILGSTHLVGGRRWQPYEGHLSFIQQFMSDFGVCGMANVHLERGLVRMKPPKVPSGSCGSFPDTLPSGFVAHQFTVHCSSTAELEVDVVAEHFQPEASPPGASLIAAHNNLTRIIKSLGYDAGRLRDAVKDVPYDRITCTSLQSADEDVCKCLSTALKYEQMCATNSALPTAHSEKRRTQSDPCIPTTPKNPLPAAVPLSTRLYHQLKNVSPVVPSTLAPSFAQNINEFDLHDDAASEELDVYPTCRMLDSMREGEAEVQLRATSDVGADESTTSEEDAMSDLRALSQRVSASRSAEQLDCTDDLPTQPLDELHENEVKRRRIEGDCSTAEGQRQVSFAQPILGTQPTQQLQSPPPAPPLVRPASALREEVIESPVLLDFDSPKESLSCEAPDEAPQAEKKVVFSEGQQLQRGELHVTASAIPVLYSVTLSDLNWIRVSLVAPSHNAAQLNCMFLTNQSGVSGGATDSESLSARARRLTQLYRLLTRPSLPIHTAITPKHNNAKDPRAQGMRAKRIATVGSINSPSVSLPLLRICLIEVLPHCKPSKAASPKIHPLLAVCVASTTTLNDIIEVHTFAVRQERRRDAVTMGRLWTFCTEDVMLIAVRDHLLRLDPDVISSWDTQKSGFGFYVDRCRIAAKLDILADLSRLRSQTWECFREPLGSSDSGSDVDARHHSGNEDSKVNPKTVLFPRFSDVRGIPQRHSQLRVCGRIVVSLWKVVKSELKQKSYTLQAVHSALFHEPFPCFHDGDLASWFLSDHEGAVATAYAALHYLCRKAVVPLQVARKLDIFVRTSQMASLYGILFFEVLTRGSQFRVESSLQRFSKPLGFVMISPSREQVMLQNKQEGIPLVMEPFSGFYREPIIVLDFRSLYPSVIIAYNICYSTCLGKLAQSNKKKIGAVGGYCHPCGFVASHIDHLNVAPNSVMFVRTNVREGVLPSMLRRILDTRFEVQAVMKEATAAGEEELYRVLHAQQQALKMLANVTYGYTAATFTGRMPCSDIADAIVLLGRRTLERAIQLIESTPKWNAKVVYGDTDSLFVHLPQATRLESFTIADEIVREVTSRNPSPITLKFEKVFLPSLMITKKRYVGYAWESKDQTAPKFDAKGIETVRRDQCSATSKICEELLHMLFESRSREDIRGVLLRAVFESPAWRYPSNGLDYSSRSQVGHLCTRCNSSTRSTNCPSDARPGRQQCSTLW